MVSVTKDNVLETSQEELRIPLDPMHNGIRLAVIGTFIGGVVAGYLISAMFFPNIVGLSIVVAVVFGATASTLVERTLKDRWASGREFIADEERITITKNGKMEFVVDASQHVNVEMWHFTIKKDSPRAKKGWHLVSLGLRQEDTYLIVYTAMNPDAFEDFEFASAFTRLEKKNDKAKKDAGASSGLRRAGEQKRLHDAEIVRQMLGGDMPEAEFIKMTHYLQEHYPRWMTIR